MENEQAVTPKKHGGGRPAYNTSHGLYTLKRAAMRYGIRTIDGRTKVGVALRKWRHVLIQDLGGDLSIQQLAIVDEAVKLKLIIDSLDAWLLDRHTLINRRNNTVVPVVMQRAQLGAGYRQCLAMLGLERRSKEVSLKDYVQQKYGNGQDEKEDQE